MEPLAPCPACRRHVMVSELACPFCAATIERGALVSRRGMPEGTLSRAAALALGASLAATACEPIPAAIYGGPPPRPEPSASTSPPKQADPPVAPSAAASGTAMPPEMPMDIYGGPPPPRPTVDTPAPAPTPTTTSSGTKPKQVPASIYGGPPPRQPK